MRYLSLLLLVPCLGSLPLLATSVTASPALLSQRNEFTQDFWTQAKELVEEQLYLINQAKVAIAGPDVKQVEIARGQLYLHLGVVERFMQSRGRNPRVVCSNGTSYPSTVTSEMNWPEKQVYCSLYASTQKLRPVVNLLEERLPMLAGLAAPISQPQKNRPLILQYDLQKPVQPRYSQVPEFPHPEPPVIGFPAKRPTADPEPFQPAIKPPERINNILVSAREELLSILPVFPASVQVFDPTKNREIIDLASYGLSPAEPQIYAKFLQQPNTGIARVLLAESYRITPNQLRNRLQPTVRERFPFAPLITSNSGLTPRLALQITEDYFQIPLSSGLDYGFIVNLGAISLEKLKPNLKNISTITPEQRDFFLNYSPPKKLEAIQVDRRRLVSGKDILGFVPAVRIAPSNQAPVVLNSTYLVRFFQFQLPEAILKREIISREQRRHLDEILETPSSDVLVAFQPVSRRADGSYTVIWRVLKQFPDPKITDLERYLDLD
jgi:hypothetical protein